MADNRPLLFFDSGVGGLSVLAPARALLPNAPIVYAADNAGFPYGTRSEAEIAARVPALLGRLAERYDPRLIVVACNTASTIALAAVRAALDLPVVGTVPAIKPAARGARTRAIGVLGTEATVRQPYVDDLSARFAADCLVLRHGSARAGRAGRGKARRRADRPRRLCRRARRPVRPAGRRADRHDRARLHPLPARRRRTGRRLPAPDRLRRWRAGHRPPHRPSDRRRRRGPRRRGLASPCSPAASHPGCAPPWRASGSLDRVHVEYS